MAGLDPRSKVQNLCGLAHLDVMDHVACMLDELVGNTFMQLLFLLVNEHASPSFISK